MIKRAWSATCPDGPSKDRFADTIASRVMNEIDSPWGGSVELVDNWLEVADRLFDSGVSADDADLSDLYEIVIDTD